MTTGAKSISRLRRPAKADCEKPEALFKQLTPYRDNTSVAHFTTTKVQHGNGDSAPQTEMKQNT